MTLSNKKANKTPKNDTPDMEEMHPKADQAIFFVLVVEH